MDWIRALDTLRDQGHPAVLVTLTDVHGHAPRDPGAKLVVSAIGRWGSVGGGNLEAGAVARAEAMLREGLTRPEFLEFGLNEHVPTVHGRQCCGGRVQLLLEPVPVRPTVAVFGLGHVGYEVARIVSRLDVQLHLVDTRSGVLTAEQEADLRTGPARIWRHQPLVPEAVLELLPAGSHLVVLTHDHAEDMAICDAVLRRPGWGSVGLIGSTAKWARFRMRLQQAGHPAVAVDRIRCPMGLPGIEGKAPAVIAISVVAELARTWVAAGVEPSEPVRRPSVG
ncbi:xanthine dehydrogenase accessory protein XdhC [Tessaracoccus rhinocerotis]|uniref:Xanthine dehydrogenase accessory protein XdhC n=1 Tax=Tessaracoccus rhinocerotis TaxID=1689449 RepID=A0A553K0J2_9ACTN|nr:xanthine dehydrogenase accessory protein XdhC [Tessaracoccus rhinocerotis]TRY18226.1 xanthine dehydrogenase accessory protein XdhC [Tessaracoccus rhinocerotis]